MSLLAALLLTGQIGLAFLAVHAMRARVLPSLDGSPLSALVADVWGPLVVLLPLLFHLGATGDAVAESWVPLGAPATVGVLGLGVALVRGGEADARPPFAASAAWAAAAIVLLLLGLAHDLTIAVGQCSFALAVILLWMNTPAPAEAAGPASPPAGGGPYLLLAVAGAIGQGPLILMMPPGAGRVVSGAVAIGGAAAIVTGRAPSPSGAVRLAGWTAAYGVLLALGVLSLRRLLPVMASFVFERVPLPPLTRVAHGFAAFAPEAAALLAAVLLVASAPPRWQRASGVLAAAMAVAIIVFRFAALW